MMKNRTIAPFAAQQSDFADDQVLEPTAPRPASAEQEALAVLTDAAATGLLNAEDAERVRTGGPPAGPLSDVLARGTAAKQALAVLDQVGKANLRC